jgi:toxin ParE1/3/4
MKRVIRPLARDDILRQYRYFLLTENAPLAAQRFLKAVRETITQVCRLPGIGSVTTLKNSKLTGLRSWPVKGFEAVRA